MRPLFEAPKAHRGELGQLRTHPAFQTAVRLLRGLVFNYERAAPAAKKRDIGTKSRNYEDLPFGRFLGRFVSQTTNQGQNLAPSQALSRVSPTRAPEMCR